MKQLISRKNSTDRETFTESVFMNTICFCTSGSAHVRSFGSELDISENSLFYIPEGSRCSISWVNESGKIEYFMLQAINNYPETVGKGFALQRVDELSDTATRAKIENIHSLLSTKDHTDSVRAIAEYYSLYALILPLLKRSEPRNLNPVLKTAIEYIEGHFCENFKLSELAAYCNISTSRLSHIFSEELGTTPIKLRSSLRIEKAADLLRTTDHSISKIAYDCGFETQAYFTQCFEAATGKTPNLYRQSSSAALIEKA